jgi:hypothetical protein
VSAPEPLRRALRAGSKLRLLTVVCERNHVLAEVWVGTDGRRWMIAKQRDFLQGVSRPGVRFQVSRIGMYVRLDDLDGPIEVTCPHRRAVLDPRWIAEQIDARRRRVRIGSHSMM